MTSSGIDYAGSPRGSLSHVTRWAPLIIVALVGTIGAFAAFYIADEAEDARTRGVIELRAEWRARDFEQKLGDIADSVEAMASLVASGETVNPEVFHRFAAHSYQAGDPLRRLMWAPRVVRDAPNPGGDAKLGGAPADSGGDSDAFPIMREYGFTLLEPRTGSDLAADPGRRLVLERSRDEGRPLSTPPMPLFSSTVVGYMVVWPIYQNGIVPETVGQRRAQFRGFVAGTFPVENTFNAAIRETPPIVEKMYFFAGRPRLPAAPVATYSPGSNSMTQGGAVISAAAPAGSVRLIRSIDVFGQEWTLIFDFDRSVLASMRSSAAWTYPAAVLLLTAILLAYLAREQGYRRQVESAVAARTAELSRANLELNAVIQTSPVGIFMVDRAGVVTLWNASTERIFGYTEAEAIGRVPPYLTEDHMADFRANLHRATNEDAATGSLQTQRRRKDGAAIDVSVSWGRVADATGQLLGIMYAVTDITERKKLESQLQQSQKMEAIGNLTGGMAHDFNNLLGIIIGNLDLLRDRQTADPEADELSSEALDAALRGADLTKRLLAFARRQPLQPELREINELVAGISTLLKRTLGEQVEITLDLGADVWPVVVDPAQLESSLTNLATNARDAMLKGGQLIIVTSNRHLDEDYASQHAEVQSGDYAMIEVTDTGTGIPPEVASRIFEPFYTTKEQGKGTGLGLSMVFGFIKQSGGHINVYSEVGIGTTFRLYLPRADVDTEAAAPAAPEPLIRGGGETVLAVEDNVSLRRVVVRQLTELGYRVLEAEDAQTALRVLDRERVDLVFTDIVMPGGTSGYDLARTAQLRWPEIKIVLTSGFPENRLNGNEHPSNVRLLSKPYRRDDLGRTIREVLEGGS